MVIILFSRGKIGNSREGDNRNSNLLFFIDDKTIFNFPMLPYFSFLYYVVSLPLLFIPMHVTIFTSLSKALKSQYN